MAQCHAERRKHPSAMDFYVGALHGKLHNSGTHWPAYKNATSANAGYIRPSQSFRQELAVESRASVFGGSLCESTDTVNPSLKLKSSGNVSYSTVSDNVPQRKIVDSKLHQVVSRPQDVNSLNSKALTSQSNGGSSAAKDTTLSPTKASSLMNLQVEKNGSPAHAREATFYQLQPIVKESKPHNTGFNLLSSNGVSSSAVPGMQASEKSSADSSDKNGSTMKLNCNDELNNLPRIYKSAELGVAFTSKGISRAGNFDAGNRLYKSGEQIALKGATSAGNSKECLIGGLIVGGQRGGALGPGDPSSSTPSASKEGGKWSSGGSNGCADSAFPTIGGSPTVKDGGRRAASFLSSGSSDGGIPMAMDVLKRSSSCGYNTAESCGGNTTSKDAGRWVSSGNVLNSRDAPFSASVRGMGNILPGNSKFSISKAGCNDNKVGDCPSKKSEDVVPLDANTTGRGLLTSNTIVDGVPNRNLGNLCTGNWSSSVSNGNVLSHGMATKAHSKSGDKVRNGSEPLDPEDLKNAGNDHYKMGHFLEAVALYDKSIALCPTHAPYRSNRAAALTGLGRLGEAVVECEEAIKLDPGYVRAHQRAGHLYLRIGMIESAKRHLQAACLQDNVEEAQSLQAVQRHISRCIEARKIGDWRNALRESNAAVAAGADSAPQVFGYKSEALLKLHRLQEAEAVCAAALRHESSLRKVGVVPADSFLYMLRAHIEMSLGRFEDAIGAAEAAVKIDPRNPDAVTLAKKAQAVGQTRTLGNELFKAGRLFEACAVYGEGLESDPTNAVLLCNRAACRSKLDQWEKAIEDCDAALIAQPNYIKALMRRAHCSAKLERWEDALRDYEVLRVEMPNDMEVARGYFDAQVALKKSRGEEIHKMKFGGEVEEVFNEGQFKEVVTFPGLSVVQFITRWSDRCCQISPFIDQLCKRFPCVHFVKVDVEDNPCLAKTESVTFIPTFKIYKSGQKVKELLGPSEQALEHAVKHYCL